MDKDFALSPAHLEMVKDDPISVHYHNQIIEYIGNLSGRVLDVGERNPLTKRLENHFNLKIDSTMGDLDRMFICDKSSVKTGNPVYDIVIFSHVIEHLFNPLFCLQNIKKVMHNESILIISTPIKPEFITTGTGHFHEMDEYRFKKLVQRAGFKIIRWEKFHIYNNFTWKRFTGIRPFIRMFYKCHSCITLTK
jgi:SAM-dependent methyltransferase